MRIYIVTGILMVMAASAAGQWLKIPTTGIPMTREGKPNLTAPAPKLPDGKPDLSGVWDPTGNGHLRDIAAGMKEEVPFQPWAKKVFDERATGAHSKEDPDANCLPQGVPKINAAPAPWKVIQTKDNIAIIYEAFNLWRQIFMDGRQRAADLNPSWHGYSLGKWEGDTLVVDTVGFNGKAWLDQLGRPTTDKLHVTERFRRKDFGHMEIQVTIDDPGAYTKPWTVNEEVRLVVGGELLEFICNENNRDVEHLPGR